ncbi:hypothetical protein [Bacillus chungangensis]|uniref:DUF3102 domain-containing protein n=1 Tax=Bacillus chungangensis TaxID=587633 RepID=A0ABT9WME3_9BACI|nr:hypothetical protein [Bacillus chungangensis]MDQ0174460.1 hypothetical protein [Bacillus chungangensis]
MTEISNGIAELSKDLNVMTAEINAYQRVAGEAIFEIGRRLKWVRDNPKEYGFEGYQGWEHWCSKSLNITRRHANRFIKVYERFAEKSGTPGSRLPSSITVLTTLAEFTDEELEKPREMPDGSTKKLTEMSRREIEEFKRRERKAIAEKEKALAEAEAAKKRAEQAEQRERMAQRDADLARQALETTTTSERPYGVKLGVEMYSALEELSEWQKKYSWIITNVGDFARLAEADPNFQREFKRLDEFWRQMSVAIDRQNGVEIFEADYEIIN